MLRAARTRRTRSRGTVNVLPGSPALKSPQLSRPTNLACTPQPAARSHSLTALMPPTKLRSSHQYPVPAKLVRACLYRFVSTVPAWTRTSKKLEGSNDLSNSFSHTESQSPMRLSHTVIAHVIHSSPWVRTCLGIFKRSVPRSP